MPSSKRPTSASSLSRARFTRLADDYGGLRGLALEQQIRANPNYYLHKYAKRVQLLNFYELLEVPELVHLSEAEQDVLARTDIFAKGVSRTTGSDAILVVEATWRPHSGDVEREVKRKDILTSKGLEALAVVVSVKPADPSVRHLAENLWVVLESAEADEPTEAA
jgi:hypothetical protein